MMILIAHASSKTSGAAGNSQNRRGSGSNYARDASQQRRGPETMSQYYRRTGMSALGGNSRTRGRVAPIVSRYR